MRIGYFISHFPYEHQFTDRELARRYICSGAEIVAQGLALHMARRGHDVMVFTTAKDAQDSFEKQGGVTVHRFGARLGIGSTRISFKLLRAPHRHDVDIVHAHNGTLPGVISAVLYARKKKRPLVITHHGNEVFTNYGSIFRRLSVLAGTGILIPRVFSRANRIISPSRGFISDSQLLKKFRERVSVIPNGIDLEIYSTRLPKEQCRRELGIPEGDPVILFVGSLIPTKGIRELVTAMTQVSHRVPGARLIVVGDGILRDELRTTAHDLGLRDRVDFVGFVGDVSKKVMYYRASDVLALPSTLSEVLPTVSLEAMATGLPIVASKLGGIPDMVEHNVNGILVPPGDIEGLADGIATILLDSHLRQRMSAAALNKAAAYDWGRIAAQTEELYLGLVS